MWSALARIILRNRFYFLLGLGVITIFMGYMATKIELSYSYARALPVNDESYLNYEEFKKLYGEDGNVVVIGVQDSTIFSLNKFNAWYDLGDRISKIDGIKNVMSIGRLYNIVRNDSLSRFDFVPLLSSKPKSQHELDSIKGIIYSLRFYDQLFINKETHATIMALTFDQSKLNSKSRLDIVDEIDAVVAKFQEEQHTEVHLSGMPYIRSKFMKKVSGEMKLFLVLALCVTTLILWIFFKSFNSVFYSLIVVVVGVIWSLGILALFGYKITILSGLIPPLIIIIGLPNCIFLINKYQEQLLIHGNKMKALTRTVEKVGLSNFLANITTSIGFAVFYFTNSTLLMEFGLVAAINVMATFTVAMIFIPIMFSFLPTPSIKHTKHLSGKRINWMLELVDRLVHNHRKKIYLIITIITAISLYGMTKINVIGYVVDDLPKKDPIYTHLRFFEENFKGVLPFEVSIDTQKENGVFSDNATVLYKINSLQKIFKEYPEFSKPVSIVEAVKFSYQAYKDGEAKYYILPGSTELKNLTEYTSSVKGQENKLANFIDSTKRYTRVSYQMSDVGSVRIKELMLEIQVKIDSIFNPSEYKVALTGFSSVFLKSNDYLFYHLFVSLLIAIVLILLIGMVLFRSVAIIVLSKLPCLIPLVMTAGIMGFFDIPFKSSTILIFSIAFGIASDGTIYILTEYRHQLRKNKRSRGMISKAVSLTIKETGLSMIYTAVILFSGFAIFAASSFGGTQALGILISITLLVSLVTNLVLLPCILLSLEKRIATKEFIEEQSLLDIEEDEKIGGEELEEFQEKH
ncbi:MAG: MMPL family transporter [Bacteroidetes bacterium]|nr:MMPL family transporter [Bacteroidota bacterium]